MATLTSSYQYLGRSSVMTSTGGTLNYYILLYGKTSANQTTGIHTVTIKEVLASINDGATYYIYAQAHNGKINGTTAFSGTNKPSSAWEMSSFTADGVTYKTGTLLGEGSVNVDATDGNAKNITLSCYYAFNDTAASYTPAYGTSRTVSVTATLAAIPRATTPTISASPYTMGTALTITLAPPNSTFKHKLDYAFGSLTGQTSGLSTGTNFTAQGNTTVTFTPPTSLGSQIPNATSGTCTIYCYTYTSSGTHIGTKSLSITLNVPSYTPAISSVTLTGNNLLSGEYVQGKSTVTGNATLTTSYGAGVKSVSIEVDGKTYTELPFTSSVLSNGSKTVKITFTDTRSKSTTYTSSAFTVQAYSAPAISNFTLERQSNGTTVIATVTGSVAAVNNKNTKTITVTLNGVTNTITSSSYTINGTTTFTNVPTDDTLTGTAKIADYYTDAKKDAVLPTVAVTMDFYKDGDGVAFGKVAEEGNLLDVAWRIKNNSVASLIGGLGTSIPSNSNLNSTTFINPGNYVCPSNAIAQTVTNSPTKNAFKMCVHNVTNSYADASNQWTYLVREITNYQGERWVQDVNKDTGSWVFSAWRLMITSSNVGGYIGDYIKPYIKDYITEQGTYSDGWEYIKWANGRIELWADKSITFPEPTNMGNYLWRSIYSLDMSSKLKSIISGTCCVQYSGMLPTFSRHSTTLTMGEVVVATSKSFTSFTTVVPIYIIGKWK